jgi:PITH domain
VENTPLLSIYRSSILKLYTMEMFPNAGSMGGAAALDAAAPVDDGKMIDLRDKIEKAGCYARNEAAGFPMSNLFIGDSILGCKSDADEQLILHIAFREFVKVRLNGQASSQVRCTATH